MRQPVIALVAAVLVAGGASLIVAGGGVLRSQAEISVEATAATDQVGAAVQENPRRKPITTERPSFRPGVQSAARPFGEDQGTKPAGDEAALERVVENKADPAQPSKPEMPGDRKDTVLFGGVATAAGRIEAKGYRIAIAGIEPVEADETCDYQGRSWPCGTRARAAFRAWLRGRSVICELPPQAGSEIIVAPCHLGKEDVAGWLVENGWARAAPDGEYAAFGDVAATQRKGIFGAPPSTAAASGSSASSALPAPPSVSTDTLLATPIEPDVSSEPVAPIAPAPGLSGALSEFPPAPAPPPAPAQ